MEVTREVWAHRINGRLYVALNIPEHETLESYKACVRRAYGSLRGVTFERVTGRQYKSPQQAVRA